MARYPCTTCVSMLHKSEHKTAMPSPSIAQVVDGPVSISGEPRSAQESPGAPRRAQGSPREPRRAQESPGEPGEARRAQESPRAPRRAQESPGEPRSAAHTSNSDKSRGPINSRGDNKVPRTREIATKVVFQAIHEETRRGDNMSNSDKSCK